MNQKFQDKGHPVIHFIPDLEDILLVPTRRVKHFLHQCSVLSCLFGVREFGQDVCSVILDSGHVGNAGFVEMEGQILCYMIVSLKEGLSGLIFAFICPAISCESVRHLRFFTSKFLASLNPDIKASYLA